MNEKIFSHLISDTIIFHMIVYCNSIFTEILFTWGTEPRRKIMEIPGGRGYDKHHLEWKFQGGGGARAKVPSFVGGGMGIFWNYTMKNHNRGDQKLFSVIRYGTNVSTSVHTMGIFKPLNRTKGRGHLWSTQFRDEHPENPGRKKCTDNLIGVRGGRLKIKTYLYLKGNQFIIQSSLVWHVLLSHCNRSL